MKAKFLYFSIAPVVVAFTAVAQDSVVIEGGPGRVQISDRDGQPEPVRVSPESVPASRVVAEPIVPQPLVPAIGIDQTNNSTLRPDPRRVQPGTVVADEDDVVVEPVNPNLTAPVTNTPPTKMEETEYKTNVEQARRRAQLAAEMKVREGADGAEMVLRTKNMFEPTQTAQLSEEAIPVASKIVEYLAVTPYEEVHFTYVRNATVTTKSMAWERSFNMVKWLSEMDTVSNDYTVKTPKESDETEQLTKPLADGGEEFGDFFRVSFR